MKVPATRGRFPHPHAARLLQAGAGLAVRLLPRSMTYSTPFNNHGNYIISLGQLTPWLAQKAESARRGGLPGLRRRGAAVRRRTARSRACASATWDSTRTASPGPTSPPASRSTRTLTVLAEGCRGSIAKQLIAQFDLGARSLPADLRASASRSCGSCPPGACSPGASSTALGWPADCAHLRRQLPLSPRQRPRVRRLHRRARLPGSAPARRSRPSSSTRTTRASRRCSRAGRSSRPARAPSPPAAGSRRRRWRCPAPCSSAMPAARSTSPRSRACTRRSAPGTLAGEHLARERRPGGLRRALARLGGRPGAQARAQLQARRSSAACGSGLVNAAWETLTGGTSPWTLRNTRRLVAPGEARRSSPRPSATGWSARCRRATACRSCSSPATRTRRASRCT